MHVSDKSNYSCLQFKFITLNIYEGQISSNSAGWIVVRTHTAGNALQKKVIRKYTRPSRKSRCQRSERVLCRRVRAAIVKQRMVKSKPIALTNVPSNLVESQADDTLTSEETDVQEDVIGRSDHTRL